MGATTGGSLSIFKDGCNTGDVSGFGGVGGGDLGGGGGDLGGGGGGLFGGGGGGIAQRGQRTSAAFLSATVL